MPNAHNIAAFDRLTIGVVAVLDTLRWRLGAQLLVDDLAFGRGVVSM